MTEQIESIFNSAMALKPIDRLAIAERLLETVEPDDEAIADDEWAVELQRRSDEMSRDPSAGIPWEQLRDEA